MGQAISGAEERKDDFITAFNNILDAAINKIESFNLSFETHGKTLMQKMITGTDSQKGPYTEKLFEILKLGIETISEYYEQMLTAGETLMANLITGIDTKATNELLAVTIPTIMNSAVAHVRLAYEDFKGAGEHGAEGLAAGLGSTYSFEIVSRAARQLAQKAVDTAKETLEVRSPSRVFAWMGEMTGLGFVKGLNDYSEDSEDAGQAIANSAIAGLRDAILVINDFIQNGIDTQPVIRPVLDLDGLKAGASQLGDILGYNQALRINAGMGTLAYAGTSSGDSYTTNSPVFNIYQQPGQSSEELAREINRIMGRMYK